MPRQPKATREKIVGHVLRVDCYGNLITNIRKDIFDKLNPGKFTIEFGRESLTKLQKRIRSGRTWRLLCLFNSLDLLEIGIYHGDGGGLLG